MGHLADRRRFPHAVYPDERKDGQFTLLDIQLTRYLGIPLIDINQFLRNDGLDFNRIGDIPPLDFELQFIDELHDRIKPDVRTD